MRADHRAETALGADVSLPDRNLEGDGALFVLGRGTRERTVSRRSEIFHGQRVAVAFHDRAEDVGDEFISLTDDARTTFERGGRGSRDRHFFQTSQGSIHGSPVLFDDFHTLLQVGLLDVLFNVADGRVRVHSADFRQGEEAGLENGVGAAAHTGLFSDRVGVDDVELQVLRDDRFLNALRQVRPDFVFAVGAVDEERGVLFGFRQHIDLVDELPLMAGDEVRAVDQIGTFDRTRAEAQVGLRHGTGFLGVVFEVTLSEQVGVVRGDLDGVLVGADGTVRTKTEEQAAGHIVRFRLPGRIVRDAQVGEIVFDTNGEVLLQRGSLLFVEDRLRHGRREFFARETKTAGGKFDVGAADFFQSGADVEVERFCRGTRFLRAVENGDGFHAGRESGGKSVDVERTIEADFDETDFFAFSDETFDSFFDDTAAGAHHDDDVFGIRSTNEVKQMILTAGDLGEFVHVLLDDAGDRVVVRVARFASLEEDVRVLRGTADDRAIRIQRTFANFLDQGRVDHGGDLFVRHLVDAVDLVGDTETIIEMEERDAGFHRGRMSDHGHVLSFLNGTGDEHRPTGGTAGHHVGVVAENGECVRRDAAGGHVEHAGGQFTSDLEHVRDHEEKTLGSRKGTRQSTGLERTVNGTDRTGFTLHFDDLRNDAEDILHAAGSPFVSQFAKVRRRRNGIDRHDF